MRNIQRRAAVLAATSISMFVAAVPAGHASAAPVPWTMAPCATADLFESEVDGNGGWVVVTGTAVQCAPAVSGGGVRIAVYPADRAVGIASGYNVRLFPSAEPGADRVFTAAVAKPVAGEYGVCVLAGDDQRIACALISVTRPVPTRISVTMRPLTPADPLVVKPVSVSPYTGTVMPPAYGDPGGGVCGSCF
jgi:hypothetical protein